MLIVLDSKHVCDVGAQPGSPPAVLLRESYRDGGKVKTRTLANLSHWPEHKVQTLKRALKGLPAAVDLSAAFEITRSLPHGHVAAVLGSARRLGVEELIDATPSRKRDLVTAMLVAQVIAPGSKLAFARGLRAQTATSSLGQVLGVGGCDEDDLYAAMDWALARKDAIENALAARHLTEGTLVLYDVSSAAFEGRTCPLGAIGHPRDGVKGRLQIVYGLLCTTAGIPIAIEVFEGNTADPKTLAAQIDKLKHRFGLSRVCLVGDRGMLTNARIRDEVRPAQLDWISALRAPQIKALVEEGALQLSLFDEQDLVKISSPEFPGERLVCCHNPVLAEQRTRKRQDLLVATEKDLTPIAAATGRERRPLRGKDNIALRVGKVINHYKMAKHFTLEITDESFTFTRNSEAIAAEAALDGIYWCVLDLADFFEGDASAGDLGEDGFCGRCPHVRPWGVVVCVEVFLDRGDQVGNGMKYPAPQRFVGQLAEPAFHQVQPGRGCRGEMQVEPRMLSSQAPTSWCLWVA